MENVCASDCGLLLSKRAGVEAPMAIVHHHDSHRNLAWRPIPQPRQTGSPGGGGFMADVVLRKSTRGRYTSATRTREKGNTPKTAHCVCTER